MIQELTTALADAVRKHNYDYIVPMTPEVVHTLALFCFSQNYDLDIEKWINYCHRPWGEGPGKYKEPKEKV